MIQIFRHVEYVQAYGCWFCLQVGTVALLIGSGIRGRGPRLEVMTPRHGWRWSKGYRDATGNPDSNVR